MSRLTRVLFTENHQPYSVSVAVQRYCKRRGTADT